MANFAIFKYELKTELGQHELVVPQGSQFLSIQPNNGGFVAYFQVDMDRRHDSTFTYRAVWTGQSTNMGYADTYLGTITTRQFLVVHYFQVHQIEEVSF